MKNKKLVFLIYAPLIAILAAGLQLFYFIHLWSYSGPNKEFEIKNGETFGRINYRLNQEELIPSAKVFHRYAQLMGKMTDLKPGLYHIESGVTVGQLLTKLSSGKQKKIRVTIPEGKNLFEIAQILEDYELVAKKDFIKAAKDPKLARSFDIPADRLEGYLYPDTYFFPLRSSSRFLINSMVKNFERNTKGISFKNPFLNKHEIIILASVVEKETGAAYERPRIAGVFLNRLNGKGLKRPMRLQSDPTTIYGIFENFNGNLKKKHLQEKTPYNTYRINGLPQGPISNPGKEAIQAVLNPEDHHYLYFVSLNDGTHKFSRTYKEHKKAVEKFQKNRRYRQGRSWRDLKK